MPFHLLKAADINKKLLLKGKHADGRGLYLQVAKPGQASWSVQYRLGGKTKWMYIGSASLFNLAEARERHGLIRKSVHDGIDPRQSTERPVGTTFGEAVTSYLAEASPSWKGGVDGKEALSYRRSFDRIPDFLKLIAEDIQHPDTRAALKVWADAPRTQLKMKIRIGAVLKFAATGDIRSRKNGPLVVNLPALPYTELPGFMRDLLAIDPTADYYGRASRALAFTVLTASRTEEVLGMTWGEVEGDVWVVPGDRMKGSRIHRVPLSAEAVALMGDRGGEQTDYVFAARKPGSIRKPGKLWASALRDTLSQVRPKAKVTVHGFRSTFKDWTAEQTEYSRDLAEWSLAHVNGPAIERVYLRADMLDKRRPLMAEWAAFATRDAAE
jgi:integrase